MVQWGPHISNVPVQTVSPNITGLVSPQNSHFGLLLGSESLMIVTSFTDRPLR